MLSSINPDFVVAGSDQPITLTGTGFVPTSRARVEQQDRSTTYLSPTTLTLQLEQADVATSVFLDVAVVNGPPGGGSSDSLTLTVGYPQPTVTDIAPDTVVGGDGAVTLTVQGTGFMGEGISYVSLGLDRVGTTVVNPTLITASIPAYLLEVARVESVKVFNYGPGGGSSSTLELTILHPVPEVTSISPTTIIIGRATRVSFGGALFMGSTEVYWNGANYPTHRLSPSALYADLPAGAFTTPGPASIAVRTPSPGGGTSNALTVTLVAPPPRITGFTPASAQAGGSDFTLIVRGNAFADGATLLWDGVERSSTFVNDSTMTVAVTGSDLADAGSAMLRVVNPDGSESQVVGLPIVEPAFGVTDTLTVELLTTDIVADPSGSAIYAVVRDFANEYRNEVIALDTSTGDVLWHLEVGRDPRVITISDDGAYLYVGYGSNAWISRVSVATRAIDLEIPLPANHQAVDIEVFPDEPTKIATSLAGDQGLWIYDGAVARPRHGYGSQVEIAPSGERLYAYDSRDFDHVIRRFLVTGDGMLVDSHGEFSARMGPTITRDGGLIFSSRGEVLDAETFSLLGTVPSPARPFVPDVANGRVHRLYETTLTAYNVSTFEALGSIEIPNPYLSVKKMVRFGADGLAFGNGDFVVFVRSPLIG